jgi:hypothetical protein
MADAISAQIMDDETILALTSAGKSSRDIERLSHGKIDHATICRRLKHLTPRQTTEIFKNHRGDILAELQRKLLMSCDNRTLKDMAARDKIVAMGILYDKERIERGHSSEGKPLVIINRISVGTGLREGQVEENETVIDIQPVDK